MEKCPCYSDKEYSDCCEPIIKGDRTARTAEECMRSRYTAYAKKEIDYIAKSVMPDKQKDVDLKGVLKWSESSVWEQLKVLSTKKGTAEDDIGIVEFIAVYVEKGKKRNHHEISTFKKIDNIWYFDDAEYPKAEQFIRTEVKIGRNDPCSCGSGKKFKKCCGKK